MITGHARGHKLFYDGHAWRYKDTTGLFDDSRPCKRCGKHPTKEGYDACKGFVKGKESVCCGHGVSAEINMDRRKS